MRKIEYAEEVYEYAYENGRIIIWKEGEEKPLLVWQDSLGIFLDPDYGDEETQVIELIQAREERKI